MAEVMLDNRYRLVEQLGAGGMAVVWRGYDEVLGRQIAIKVLGPELAADPAFVNRLRAEAQAAARLSHPRITSVHDYGESRSDDGAIRPYVVMELVEGETLHSLLSGGRRLPWRRATTICAEVATALAEAHERGIVHRDVSSSNVMLTTTGVKVLDFGISALIGEHESADLTSLLGTPAYVAPERLSEGEITPAVDVYAVGILLYRCLRGSLPWVVDGPTELLHAHRWLTPAPLPPLPGLPSKVAALCYRCLAKDPADRPSSAELAATLAKVSGLRVVSPLGDGTTLDSAPSRTAVLPWHTRLNTPISKPPGATKPEPVASRKRHRKALVAGLALAALALAGWSLPWPEQPNRWTAGDTTGGSGGSAPDQASCHVIYLLKTDDGKQFEAALTVHNRGTEPVEAWQLEFAWPGGQSVVAAQAAAWEQKGRTMVVRPLEASETIAPGASRNLALSGTYSGINALPADFTLAGKSCQTTVAGATTTVVTVSEENGKRKKGDGDDDDDEDD